MDVGAAGLRVFRLERRTLAVISGVTVVVVGSVDVASGSFDARDTRLHLVTVAATGIAAAWCFYEPFIAVVCFSAVATADALLSVPVRNHGLILAGLLGCYLLSRAPSSSRAALGLASVALPIMTINVRDGTHGATDGVFDCLVFGSAFLVARVLRMRHEQSIALERDAIRLDQSRDQEAHRAVSSERTRIARELHDVVAHNLSVMLLHAGGVRRLLVPEQEFERRTLAGAESAGRDAMGEMRRLLGVLRAPETASAVGVAAEPSLQYVGALFEDARASGLTLVDSVEGAPRPLAPGIDLAAYRILEHAIAHARAAQPRGTVYARVRYREREIELEVVETAAPGAAPERVGSRGRVGIAERVALYDGRLEQQDAEDGSSVVRVRLPTEDRPP